MGIVIDTGVFIRWERDGGTVNLGKWSGYGEPAISVVTQSELMVGVHRANTPQRREKRLRFVQTVITNVSILPIDSRIADVHAQIVARLSDSGLTIGPHEQSWLMFGPPNEKRVEIGDNQFPIHQVCENGDLARRLIRTFFQSGAKSPEAEWFTLDLEE